MRKRRRSRRSVLVHGVAEGAPADEITKLMRSLPPGAEGRHDPDVRALVVEVDDGADVANEVLRMFAQSSIVSWGPGTEEAILKYYPDRAAEPAFWDVLEEDYAICTTCSWATSRTGTYEALEAEMSRHTARVHRGRSA
jgi:hypothetical protein